MDIDLSSRLAEYRKQNKLSQEALAEKLGLSRQAVSKWERGESSPDTVNLIALSRIYGVTIDELLGNSAPAHNDKELYNDRPPLKAVDGKAGGKAEKEQKEKSTMKERREKRKQERTEKSAVRREKHEKEAAQKQTEKAEKQAAKNTEKAEKENAAEIKKAEKDALKKEKQNEKQQKKTEKNAAKEAKKAAKEKKK